MTGPGPLGAILVGVLAVGLLAATVAIGYVVNRDAAARGVEEPARFLITGGVVLLPILVVPAYALLTHRLGTRATPATRVELILAWGALTLVVAVIVGAIVSPPDPVRQLAYVVALAVVFGLAGLVPLVRRGALGSG